MHKKLTCSSLTDAHICGFLRCYLSLQHFFFSTTVEHRKHLRPLLYCHSHPSSQRGTDLLVCVTEEDGGQLYRGEM